MIYKLQKRFIFICTVSVLAVVALVFGVIIALNVSSLNRNMDVLADRVSEGGGRFPDFIDDMPIPDKSPPRNEPGFDFITPETPFATRHFTIFFDESSEVLRPDLRSHERRPSARHGGAQHAHDQHALPAQPLRHGQYDRGAIDRSLLRLCASDQRDFQRGEVRP